MANQYERSDAIAYDRAKRVQVGTLSTFTHRQVLADGRIILADPARKHWCITNDPMGDTNYAWAPALWDESKAVAAFYKCVTFSERDVS